MPFWTLEFWEALYTIDRNQKIWVAAVKFLETQQIDKSGLSILQMIPWDTHLPSFMGSEVSLLGWYCSTRWLSDIHMEQMGTLLHTRLLSEGTEAVSILSVFDINSLIQGYRYVKETYVTSSSMHHLRDIGNRISTGVTTSVVAYICVTLDEKGEYSLPSMCGDDTGNHWISAVIDLDGKCIQVGDSRGRGYHVPEELVAAIVWWLKNHGISNSEAINKMALECSIQTDSFSCSVLCHNAVEHHFFPSDIPLVQARDALVERIYVLSRIVTYLKSVVSAS